MATEVIKLGSNDPKKRILYNKNHTDLAPVALTAEQMAAITRINMSFGTTLIDSDNGAGDPIRWAGVGYENGEYRYDLGAQSIDPGEYPNVWIKIYSAEYPLGTYWGSYPIEVIANPGAPGA